MRKFLTGYIIVSIFCFGLININSQKASAACAVLPTDKGSVSATVNVPTATTYTVWSRIKAPDTTNNSFILEIDQNVCGVVVGDSAIAANSWTWVDYKLGQNTNKVSVSLTAGTHTVRMVGRESDVQLDRLLFVNGTCAPTGTGSNCAQAVSTSGDTTKPTVTLNGITANAVVKGNVTIEAVPADNIGVSRVDFYQDGTFVRTEKTKPYCFSSDNGTCFSLDTNTLTEGAHTITAKAYDAAGNEGVVNVPINVQNDAIPPTVTISSPLNNASLKGAVTVSARATDNKEVKSLTIIIDDQQQFATTINDNLSFVWQTGLPKVTAGAHVITVKATDISGNSSTATVNVQVIK